MSTGHWKLDGRIPIPCGLMEWANILERGEHVLWQDEVGDSLVSTVFLGLDHRFGSDGPPLWFETMIFTDGEGDYMERTSTWELAREQHLAALARALFADASI